MSPQLALEFKFILSLSFIQTNATRSFNKALLLQNTAHSLKNSIMFTMMSSLQLKAVLSSEWSPLFSGSLSSTKVRLFIVFTEMEMLWRKRAP